MNRITRRIFNAFFKDDYDLERKIAEEKRDENYHFYPIDFCKENDIFIAGYPKSGNTWMQSLLAGVIYGLDTNYLMDKLTQELIPDIHYKKKYKRYVDDICFKTHFLPQPEYRRVIHLIRDPRDVMVSYYHYNQVLGVNYSLEEMIKEGKGVISTWKDHTRAYMDNPFNADKIVVRFEDLVTDTPKILNEFCEFAGIERPPDLIERVAEGCSFKKMKERDLAYGTDNNIWDNKKNTFFRKGKIGNKELSDDLIQFLETSAEAEMKHFGYL